MPVTKKITTKKTAKAHDVEISVKVDGNEIGNIIAVSDKVNNNKLISAIGGAVSAAFSTYDSF